MSGNVTHDDSAVLGQLRDNVKQDVELAIAKFKIWLLVTVLSNVVLIGVPALYVFFTTSNTANASLLASADNSKRLDSHGQYLVQLDARISALERFGSEKQGFVPSAPQRVPR